MGAARLRVHRSDRVWTYFESSGPFGPFSAPFGPRVGVVWPH